MGKDICGVVVLYNPDLEVVNNINTYLHQVEKLYVVDNSENVNSGIADKVKYQSKVEYIAINANMGIAKALNLAANLAIKDGFKYILTMDQDSRAPQNMVGSLLKTAEENSNAGIITPLHVQKYATHIKPHGQIEKVIIAMTSGNLVSLDIYKKIGGFNEDYFIDYVDIEYCYRLRFNQYDVLRMNEIILDHNEAALTEVKIFNKKIHPHNHKPVRLYYKTRNLLYLRKAYKSIFPDLLKEEYDPYLRSLIRLILFEKNKILKLKMVAKGYCDFLKGRKGSINNKLNSTK